MIGSLISTFFAFARYGLLCFGGGYMFVPLIISDFVGEGKMLTETRFGNLFSIAQLTPGPVGINAATYIGFIQGGFRGALAATLGLVFPTVILSIFAVKTISRCKDHPVFSGMIRAARVGACGLICYAVLVFLKMSVFTGPAPWDYLLGRAQGEFRISLSGTIIMILIVVLMTRTKIPITWLILLSGALGALLGPFIA